MFKITKAMFLHLVGASVALVSIPVSAWLTKYIPGEHFTSGELMAAGLAGGSFVWGIIVHYLHGWQLWERRIAPIIDVTDGAPTTVR